MAKEEREEEEEMALENIREWIFDENKIVSFKWLSFTLSMHVNESKRVLEKFVMQNRDKPGCELSVVYCVSGLVESNGFQVFKVELVAEESLKEVEASFIPPVSHHVYSVQKSSVKNLSNLYIADYDLVKQNILSSNKFSAIYCPSAKLRMLSGTVQSNSEEIIVDVPPVHNKVEKSKLNAASKGVSSFFSKQAQKASSESSESERQVSKFQSSSTKSNSSVCESNLLNTDSGSKIQSSQFSNGKNKELPKVKDKEKEGQRKRLRIAEISSSEDEEEEDPLAENAREMETEVIDSSDNNNIPVPTSEDLVLMENDTNQKRLERKLVSKTYVNDEGYMVTEKVWETSEVKEESVPVEKLSIEQPPPSKKPVIQLQQSVGGKKKTASAKGSNKQASLMKFFNKQ